MPDSIHVSAVLAAKIANTIFVVFDQNLRLHPGDIHLRENQIVVRAAPDCESRWNNRNPALFTRFIQVP